MSDQDDINSIQQATVIPKKRMRLSVVWIIPIVAALVAIGIAVQRIISEGPTITIIFKVAEGIEEGNTFIKYKNVNIGKVKAVKLSKDYTKVVVTAKIEKNAAGLIVEDAEFWVEQPRVTMSGVSGIGTLLTGNFIGLKMGKSERVRHEFIGRDVPPTITVDQPGHAFTLQAEDLGSVGIGTPLYFRRLNVGQVIGYDLAEDGKSISIMIFVNSPYDKYVTDRTRFWEASGIDLTLGAEGLSLQTQSVRSILMGGIAFETPPLAEDAKPANEKTPFVLFNSRAEAMSKAETVFTRYVLYFDETLRGLNVGAPVMFLGLPVGEVTAVGLEYDSKSKSARPRVDIVVYPKRTLAHAKNSLGLEAREHSKAERYAFVQKAVDGGLRAQLRSGNLLTGQRYVAFENFPNTPKVKIDWTKSPVELPVIPSGLQDIEIKIHSILTKIERMPLDEIGTDFKKLLATIDVLLKRIDGETLPEVKTTLEDLKRILTKTERMPLDEIGTDFKKLLATIDVLLKRIDEETLSEVKTTLEDLKRVLKSTDANLVGKDAPTQQEMRETLQEVRKAAQAINGLVDYLDRNPDALIRGKKQEGSK
jgi:paraquat-inducible protein B